MSLSPLRRMLRSQVDPAVGEIERLVDEREIGDDIAEDRVLQRRPVLPGGIVRVTAMDRAAWPRLESGEHRAAPTLDESGGEGAGGGNRHCRPMDACG